MDFKKKFDYNDISIFLPDNYTIGTSGFYQNKYPTLPMDECFKLEVLSRVEYDEKAKEDAIKKLVEEQLLYNQQIEKELTEREEEKTEDDNNDDEEYNKLKFKFSNIEL